MVIRRLRQRFGGHWFVLLALIGVLPSGCAKPTAKGQLPTVAIRGVVKIDGKPSNRAMLQVMPAEGSTGLPGASGLVADDGKYSLQTYAPGDGIPAGKYTFSLGPDFGKFAPVPPVKPLTVEIKEANSNFELNFQASGSVPVGLPRPGTENAPPAVPGQ